jgi:DNA-binding NarL/FixJ family response regulator
MINPFDRPSEWPADFQAEVVDQQEMLEDALIAVLTALAELARMTGQADRAFRLMSALNALTESNAVGGEPGRLESSPLPYGPPTRGLLGQTALSGREQQVVGLMLRGLGNREIAEGLTISQRTVDSHVQNILNKLGLNSRAQVVVWAVHHLSSPDAAG